MRTNAASLRLAPKGSLRDQVLASLGPASHATAMLGSLTAGVRADAAVFRYTPAAGKTAWDARTREGFWALRPRTTDMPQISTITPQSYESGRLKSNEGLTEAWPSEAYSPAAAPGLHTPPLSEVTECVRG